MSSKPSPNGERLDHHPEPTTAWPAWQIPATPAERSAAVTTLLTRIGLGPGQVPLWRARALLHQWWTAGACVAGLLHAIDHHPDGTPRGNALTGATDPLRVLGHRLRPWVGQLHQLPPGLAGHHGDYRAEQATRIAHRIAAAEHTRAQRLATPPAAMSTPAARHTARAALAALLADQAQRRQAAGLPRRLRDSTQPPNPPLQRPRR